MRIETKVLTLIQRYIGRRWGARLVGLPNVLPHEFRDLTITVKRAKNILRREPVPLRSGIMVIPQIVTGKGRPAAMYHGDRWTAPEPLDPGAMVDPADWALANALVKYTWRFYSHVRGGTYDIAIHDLAALSPYITNLFDNVMILDGRQNIRQNRLNMLAHFVAMAEEVANFDKIVLGNEDK